jgi:phytanoyl-CoA hydroxylase
MRRELTAREITSYRENGFLAVADFLSTAELAHWRRVVDEAINLVEQPEGSSPTVFTQRMNLRRVSDRARSLVADPAVGRLAASLEGLDAVRIYLDQALVKEPYAGPTSYHQDAPWWAFDSRHACTFWVALDDSTSENGCMYFVPGSHRLDLAYRSASVGSGLGAIFDASPSAAALQPVAAPLPAGGCSIHNARIIHGAGVNMTHGRRRAMTIAYMPDGVRYNGQRDERSQDAAYLDTLAVGDVFGNDEHNPIVYKVDAMSTTRVG